MGDEDVWYLVRTFRFGPSTEQPKLIPSLNLPRPARQVDHVIVIAREQDLE